MSRIRTNQGMHSGLRIRAWNVNMSACLETKGGFVGSHTAQCFELAALGCLLRIFACVEGALDGKHLLSGAIWRRGWSTRVAAYDYPGSHNTTSTSPSAFNIVSVRKEDHWGTPM